jgi:hypothetical protein
MWPHMQHRHRSRHHERPYRPRPAPAAGADAGGQPSCLESFGETLGRTHQPSEPHRPRPRRSSQRGPRRDRGHRHQPDCMGHARPARQPHRPHQHRQETSSQHRRIRGHCPRRPRHRSRPPGPYRSRAHHRLEGARGRPRSRSRRARPATKASPGPHSAKSRPIN